MTWHDVECASYTADLALWRELADAAGGAVLDLGAGTGRVSLDLAAHGHQVVALDVDERLLAALRGRALEAGLDVETVCADAAAFELPGRSFALAIAPMQTVQLLAGARSRAGMLGAMRRHLVPGARLAMALTADFQAFEPSGGLLPAPDVLVRDGASYVSQPTAVRPAGSVVRLVRRRETRRGRSVLAMETDVVDLAAVDAAALIAEGAAAGFTADAVRRIAETDRHVGSEVVVLRA